MNNVYETNSLDAIERSIDEVRAQVDEAGFAIIRGALSPQMASSCRTRVNDVFASGKDIRVSGDYQRESKDFQRLDLGEYPASTRFARYFMLFPWNNDRAFADVGTAQMRLLNLLSRKPMTMGDVGSDYNANRFRMSFVIQYPIGGGFMSKHREHAGEEEGDKAYVVYTALTTRGVDYESGGAYVFQGERKVDIDATARAADLVIYRGDYFHGVDGVDRDKPVNLGEVCGRMMLTTVVKYFKS